jgi:glyoxylase-like metal-dependent hydrolase (beta-lactamase superfamily II)
MNRAVALALAGLAALAATVNAAAQSFELKSLGQGVYAAIDRQGKAGANAGFVIGGEAVAVIDSFYREDAARALLDEIRKLTPLPVRYVINTHHHIDHVSGNRLFAEAGATLVAQRQVLDWVQPENLRLLGGEQASDERRRLVAALKAPQLGYEQQMSLDLGGRRILLQHLAGHTGGDTAVWVADAQVLFLGDLMWRASVPNLIDARVQRWIPTLDALDALPAATAVVPGHGEMANLADMRSFRDYLRDLQRHVDAALAQPAEPAQRQQQVLEALRSRYGQWAYFERLAPANVRDMLAEAEGRKRTPEPMPTQALPVPAQGR